jgi:hypothetical protein
VELGWHKRWKSKRSRVRKEEESVAEWGNKVKREEERRRSMRLKGNGSAGVSKDKGH